MRHAGNIFGSEGYRRPSIRTVSGISVITMIMSLISVVAAVYIIANFDEIAVRIAIWMAGFLSTGFPVLVTILTIGLFVMRLKWKMRRRFWGW